MACAAICPVAPFAAGVSRLGARLDRRSPRCWADLSSPWQPESWDKGRVMASWQEGRNSHRSAPSLSLLRGVTAAVTAACRLPGEVVALEENWLIRFTHPGL